MIITYLRSSSYNTWDFCQQQYFLDYGLGFRAPANKKAEKGTITHKALELLARKKLAEQEGKKHFYDEEVDKEWKVSTFTPDMASEIAYEFYTVTKDTIYEWEPADKVDCRDWMYLGMNVANGNFSPLNRTIVAPEQFFDFTINKPGFWYSYKGENGERIEGNLAMKGTVDLTVTVDGHPDTLELIDWKTGATRKDWIKGNTKEHRHFMQDSQLRIYHYAMCRLFPDIDNIFITIVFMRDGGAYTLPFSRSKDLPQTEKMLERRFHAIKNSKKPRLIYPNWKCDRLCHYGKNNWPGTEQTMCSYINGELLELGMDRVIEKYGELDSIMSYGQGGGRTDRDKQN